MALLHYDRGRKGNAAELDLAEVVCRQAQMLDADYAPIYNTWGLIKVYKGDVISALRFFQRAITLDPDLFEAQMNFGEVTISFRGYEDGRKAFARAVELEPNNYDAVIGLGTALRGLEQFPEAETQYQRAKQLDAKRPEAYFNLGVLYQDYMSGSVSDLKKAKVYFTEFLKRAGKQTEFRSSVQDVNNRCAQKSSNKRGAPRCRPGRMQNIDISVEAHAGHGLRTNHGKSDFEVHLTNPCICCTNCSAWSLGGRGARAGRAGLGKRPTTSKMTSLRAIWCDPMESN